MAARRRRPNPIAWLLVAVGVVLLIVVIRVLAGGDTYRPPARAVATETVKLGKEVAALRTQLKSLDHLALKRRLRTWERTATGHLAQVQKLSPPEDMRVANGYLITALGLRARAMHNYGPSVDNALSDRDRQVAVSQLLNVMRDLSLSDRAYELFRTAWPESDGEGPAASQWLADPDDAAIDEVTSFVRELNNQPSLQAEFNLTVSTLTLDPKPAAKENEIDVLPFARVIEVTLVVANTGNQAIPSVPVAAIITSESDPAPKTIEGRLASLRPGEKKSVVLRGIEPTAGVLNLLSVTIGPGAGERNTIDNKIEYKFRMRKP